MSRTTIADVKLLLDNTTLTDPVITSFISAANIFVTNTLSTSVLDVATLTEIERWISCHLITYTLERQSKREEAGSAKIEYAGDFSGSGLKATSYGQMAITLDTTNTLAQIAQGKKDISIQAL